MALVLKMGFSAVFTLIYAANQCTVAVCPQGRFFGLLILYACLLGEWGVLSCARRLIWGNLSVMHSGAWSEQFFRNLWYDSFYNLPIPWSEFQRCKERRYFLGLLTGVQSIASRWSLFCSSLRLPEPHLLVLVIELMRIGE